MGGEMRGNQNSLTLRLWQKGFTLSIDFCKLSSRPPVSTSQWHTTAEIRLIKIVGKWDFSWMPCMSRKLAMQLQICLGNRTDMECWHIIKLRLISWIIASYLIILKCPLGFVCVMCAQHPVFLCRGMGLAWGSFAPRKRADSLSSGGLD